MTHDPKKKPDLFAVPDYEAVLDRIVSHSRRMKIRVFATDEEKQRLVEDSQELDALEAVCEERRLRAEAAALERREADERRRRRLGAAAGLEKGGFPLLLIAHAVGKAEGTGDARALVDAPAPRDTAALKHARAFVDSDKTALLLLGGAGAGKSFAATWAAFRVGGWTPGFLRATELERRGRYDRELHDWLKDRTMLVIDDIGAEAMDSKGYFCSLFDEVVDRCYGDGVRLVITTNLLAKKRKDQDPDQFIERYGDRVWSRLCEVATIGNCGGEDLRRAE